MLHFHKYDDHASGVRDSGFAEQIPNASLPLCESRASNPKPHLPGGTFRSQRQSRLIELARYPAPKPLSMLTTATLGAQLFSMPSRAARPPKLAP
jgi:hypothetical protein